METQAEIMDIDAQLDALVEVMRPAVPGLGGLGLSRCTASTGDRAVFSILTVM